MSQVSKIKGFIKNFAVTGESTYDALNKQPIQDADNKLNAFNKVTQIASNAIETFIKSMVDLINGKLIKHFEECSREFVRHDLNDSLLNTLINDVIEAQKHIFNELNTLTLSIHESLLRPLQEYQKEVHSIKENRKELKESYDRVEQMRKSLDKSRKEVDTNRRQLDNIRYANATSAKQNEQARLLTASEEKSFKYEKELDECERVASEKYDKYTESLYKNVSQEQTLARYFLDYLKIQQKHHFNIYTHLNDLIPLLELKILKFNKRILTFNICSWSSLEDCINNHNNNEITTKIIDDNLSQVSPIVIKLIESMLKQNAQHEEGLFRVAGSRIKANCLIHAINAGYLYTIDFNEFDVHCLASVLKQYLRDLPDSLLCTSLMNEWSHAVNQAKLHTYKSVLSKLPKVNYENLKYIIRFLARITDNCEQTKMNTNNIGICFGVSLLNDMNIATRACEYLVANSNDLFPYDSSTILPQLDTTKLSESTVLRTKREVQQHSFRSSMMLPSKSNYLSSSSSSPSSSLSSTPIPSINTNTVAASGVLTCEQAQKSPSLSVHHLSFNNGNNKGHTKTNSCDNRIGLEQIMSSPDSRHKCATSVAAATAASKKLAPAPPPSTTTTTTTTNTASNITNQTFTSSTSLNTSTNNLNTTNTIITSALANNNGDESFNFEQLKNKLKDLSCGDEIKLTINNNNNNNNNNRLSSKSTDSLTQSSNVSTIEKPACPPPIVPLTRQQQQQQQAPPAIGFNVDLLFIDSNNDSNSTNNGSSNNAITLKQKPIVPKRPDTNILKNVTSINTPTDLNTMSINKTTLSVSSTNDNDVIIVETNCNTNDEQQQQQQQQQLDITSL